MKPIILECEQGSQKWLSLRKTKITATDSSVIMNVNPWKTPYRLWEEKLDLCESQPVNQKMIEGTILEEQARDFWNKKVSSDYKPAVLGSTQHDFMMASLDGINSNGDILEIKCGQKSHEMAKNHEIAPYYFAQIQKQLYVSNVQLSSFLSYRSPEDFIHFTIERDDEFIEKMVEAEKEFYRCMMELTPPKLSKKDYLIREDQEWEILAEALKKTKKEINRLEEEEENLRDELIRISRGESSQGAGITLTKCIGKGKINYSKIEELKNVDLEKYRGKPVNSWRITTSEEK